ncbi:hypothetical protein F3Y22_tig00113725pilonHSYRG00267 [Hibiscus syriacus]|uniref:Reverse transcriptase zinc-binding domain-containing protein n=1 Tax=Hibiscus syriacus TaxID=106335 RepID=A0A6A2WMH0_HIBSY|nr:hypothetical protein F3Y22_tig00113725pilonHSYRG00267 [Hibiscus syriacus]
MNHQTIEEEPVWKAIRQAKILPIIKSFVWLAAHGALLTNKESTRRHLALDASCRICNNEEEDINHILRLCPTASTLWVELVKEEKLEEFLALGINEWILKNLTSSFCFAKEEEAWVKLYLEQSYGTFGNKEINGSLRLNGPNGVTACGGVIRDEKGEWIMGFHKAIEICSILEAELWGVLEGMKIAWELVWYYVADMIRKDWNIQAAHTLRKGNKIADEMVKLGRKGD